MPAKSSATAQTTIQFSFVLLAASALSFITFSPNVIAQSIDTSSHQNAQTAKEQITNSTQPQLCYYLLGKKRCY